MEKNLVCKLEAYLKPRLEKIIGTSNEDKQMTLMINIIKTITGEEEGTPEFYEYYDYAMNKMLYPDETLDKLNESVELNQAEGDDKSKTSGVKKRGIVGKAVDKRMAMATSSLGDNRFKRRNRLRKDTNKAEKAEKKLDKAKTKGSSEKKISKLSAKSKTANMRKTASTIAVKSDQVKKAAKKNENDISLNESFEWKLNYGEDAIERLNERIVNANSIFDKETSDVFETVNDFVSAELNLDSMSEECMSITTELMDEYSLNDYDNNGTLDDEDYNENYLDDLVGDMGWVDED